MASNIDVFEIIKKKFFNLISYKDIEIEFKYEVPTY